MLLHLNAGIVMRLYFIAAGSDKIEVKYQIKDGQTWAENVEIKKTKAQEQGIIRLHQWLFYCAEQIQQHVYRYSLKCSLSLYSTHKGN